MDSIGEQTSDPPGEPWLGSNRPTVDQSLQGRSAVPITEPAYAAVVQAMRSRRSIRGYLPKPVDRAVIVELLRTAAKAPSGSNIQPWQVHVLTGGALRRVSDALSAAFEAHVPENPDYQHYPRTWREPYLGRRRAAGWELYELAGIERGDREAGNRQKALDYRFFGAPVGLVFTIEDDLEQGSWLDYGMFLQSVMIAARSFDLDTCPQAAIANDPDILRQELSIAASSTIVCGMALGYADPGQETNKLVTMRESVESFTQFHEDESENTPVRTPPI